MALGADAQGTQSAFSLQSDAFEDGGGRFARLQGELGNGQATAQLGPGGLGGAGTRGRREAQGAQAPLPLPLAVQAACNTQAFLSGERGLKRRADPGQFLQTANPGQQAFGAVEFQVDLPLAFGVVGQPLPAEPGARQSQVELPVVAHAAGIELATCVELCAGHGERRFLNVQKTIAVGGGEAGWSRLPQGLQLRFAQLQTAELRPFGLLCRRLDAGLQSHRIGGAVGGGCAGAQAAVQCAFGQFAPEQGGADTFGVHVPFPVAHCGGFALRIEPEAGLAQQFAATQPGHQLVDGPLVSTLVHLGLQRLQWQSLLVCGAHEAVVELDGCTPSLTVGLGPELAAQVGGGSAGPQSGQVEVPGADLGREHRLSGPGLHAGLEGQLAGLGTGCLRRTLGLGGHVQCGVWAAECAARLRLGGEIDFWTVRNLRGDGALQIQAQGHGGLTVQVQPGLVLPIGQPERIQLESMGADEGVDADVGGWGVARQRRSVLVVPSDAGQRQIGVATELQHPQLESQAHRYWQGERFHGFAGCGRALVPNLERAHLQRSEVYAPAPQGVHPERVVPVELHLGGAYIQFGLRPAQRGDLSAAAQAAFHTFGVQRANAFSLRAALHPALCPVQGLSKRSLRAGPQPERQGAGQQQGDGGTRYPQHQPACASQQLVQRAGRTGWVRLRRGGCGGNLGGIHQKLNPTLR